METHENGSKMTFDMHILNLFSLFQVTLLAEPSPPQQRQPQHHAVLRGYQDRGPTAAAQHGGGRGGGGGGGRGPAGSAPSTPLGTGPGGARGSVA